MAADEPLNPPLKALGDSLEAEIKLKDIKKHPVNQVPSAPRTALLSVQHVLAFYAGAVVVPLIVAGGLKLDAATTVHLINADLFTCGIATLIQSIGFWRIGVRLPIVQGVTTMAISPMIAIGLAVNQNGGTEVLPTIYGAVIVAGLFTFFAAPLFAKLIRFFPPLVIGIVLTTMGTTLLGVSAADVIGRVDEQVPPMPITLRSLAYGLGTLAIIVLIQRFFKGFMGTLAVLAGLVIGTGVAAALGDTSFSEVGKSSWVAVTTPFYFGWPQFSLTACISMIVVMLLTMVETTGDVFATGEIVGKRIGKEEITAALRADGLSTTLGGILNSFPYTCFAQNIGLVRLTKVHSRWVVACAGGIMIILGVIPKAGAIVASIPSPVLGGASMALFANLTLVGIQTLSRVDLSDTRSGIILTTSIALAMLVSFKPAIADAFPAWAHIFFASGVTLGSISAILLNLLFFHVGPRSKGEDVALGTTGKRRSLRAVNKMSSEEFVNTFARLFNGVTWPLQAAAEMRPFRDVGELKEALQDAVMVADKEAQDQLIASYPDVTTMLTASESEAKEISQDVGSLALGQLTEEQKAQLHTLESSYHEKFNLPLVALLSRMDSVDAIIKDGVHRLENSPRHERVVALGQVVEVINDRLEIMMADANPIRSAWSRKFEQLD
ncbi:solute carrier family 23 protein [Varibaculum prostatecancerukia]|uniref:solute carrier family 23 protein n=1 Tax=Varibaculum prostatecancerukia TaxID=2811781 RepID=UPI001C0024F5|nr:solute carrier family 23 protein [Varibaculum prostatecancerukia]